MSAEREKAAMLSAQFEAAGAICVKPPVLLPADTLLDLYGEDILGRAYVTSDALRGTQMLRPDFTVPVVQMHMENGAEPARYTYFGEVFRRQETHPERAHEYLQVGYEVFDRTCSVTADAEVFALISTALKDISVRAVTGDIGILSDAVSGLHTTEARKAALTRHIWRPRRFRTLLDRFGGKSEMTKTRKALIDGSLPQTAVKAGRRDTAEIEARIDALRAEANADPISSFEMDGVEALLNVRETLPFALEQMRDVAIDLPSISMAVDRFELRMEKLAALGVAVDDLAFEASYGRTSMEYYDGFVFGFYANQRPDLPPLATGGRYDALTKRLGNGIEIPAVGAVLRPELIVELEKNQ